MNILLNPFKRLAGWKTLITGVVVMVLAAFASTISNTHFDGVLDIHFAADANFSTYIVEHLTVWFTLIIVFGATALILNKNRFRFIDLAGMTAFSRIPISITAFLAMALNAEKVVSYIKFEFLGAGKEIVLTNYDIGAFIILLLLSVVLILWSLTWLYHALRILGNASGMRVNIGYIAAVFISEVITKVSFWLML